MCVYDNNDKVTNKSDYRAPKIHEISLTKDDCVLKRVLYM